MITQYLDLCPVFNCIVSQLIQSSVFHEINNTFLLRFKYINSIYIFLIYYHVISYYLIFITLTSLYCIRLVIITYVEKITHHKIDRETDVFECSSNSGIIYNQKKGIRKVQKMRDRSAQKDIYQAH